MTRSTLKSALAGIVVAGLLAATLTPGAAHAARPRHVFPSHPSDVNTSNCQVINVQLNGFDQPATATCGLSKKDAANVSPNNITASWGCADGNALELFDNVGYDRNGALLCLSGNGGVNLQDYGFNDMMSSWQSWQQQGKVYWDWNLSGSNFVFYKYQSNPNVGSGWNDQASSVCINNTSGPSGCP